MPTDDQRHIEVPVRVRYVECDPMNVAHHSVYPVWFEIARTDLLRRRGNDYKDLEAAGVFFVVARMSLRYHKPAKYDDELLIICSAQPSAGVKVESAERAPTLDDRRDRLSTLIDDYNAIGITSIAIIVAVVVSAGAVLNLLWKTAGLHHWF